MNVAQMALARWGLAGANVTLIAARENAVYRVDAADGPLALRLHRKGYRSDAELAAELDWMAVLSKSGLSVPTPIKSISQSHLEVVDDIQVDVLTWLEGETLDKTLPTFGAEKRRQIFRQLGCEMASLHAASDAWKGAASCNRPAWNAAGLLGDAPLWGRFWENPGLVPSEQELFLAFRDRAEKDLISLSSDLDFGLIHADLVPANVMIAGDAMHLIDFDDGGFGFRLFEVATALLKHCNAPDYEALQSALIEGYLSRRPLNTSTLNLFLALRAVTYVGWNIARAGEDRSDTRNARFIAQATDMVATYLDG